MKPRIIFIFLIIVKVSHGFSRQSPNIISENGHLTIRAAQGKNISIKTDVQSRFDVNGVNFQQIIDWAKSGKKYPDGSNFPDIDVENTLDRLNRRISRLEADNHTVVIPRLAGRFPTMRMFNNVRTKVRRLEGQVSRFVEAMTKNECLSVPCQHGGTCLDIFNGFLCLCPKNWEGPQCNEDVNECGQFSGTDLGCRNGATCTNTIGSYTCICAPGFFGLHCSQKTNDCTSASSQELCGHGSCTTSGNGIKCICDPGWKTDGVNPACNVDVNECDTKDHRCSVNPQTFCINYPGGYTCGPCPLGYSGDGYSCYDVNECKINNGGCSTNPLVQCVNTMGSRMCSSCPPGYSGDGVNCQLVGLCQINNGGCHPLARCFANPGTNFVQCICQPGFTGSGYGINGCAANGSETNIPTPPSIFPQFRCSPNPCVNGTCHSTPDGHFCVCNPGYTGSACNKRLNHCDSNPCLNGGTCVDDVQNYKCFCADGFRGRNCHLNITECGDILDTLDTYVYGMLYTMKNKTLAADEEFECKWKIVSMNPDNIINITFTKFNLGSTMFTGCHSSSLRIFDGPDEYSDMVGKYCGTTLPNNGTILSTTKSMFLLFHSKKFVDRRGFHIRWSSRKPPCGERINATSFGTIKSLGYPKNYTQNEDCYWKVVAPPGKRIQFNSFTLHMENHPDCTYDYLKFYDGLKVSETHLAEYCTSKDNIQPLVSSSSDVLIHFHTDNKNSDLGFQLSYNVIEGIPGCGGTYTMETGEISSPSVNGEYLPNLLCEYKIILSQGVKIKLTYLEFEMEPSSDCMFDYVAVYDGESTESNVLSRSCGNSHPKTLISTSNKLFLVFASDNSLSGAGFKIKYEIVCHQTLTEPTGILKSPDYPYLYPSSRTCTYSISVPAGSIIKLSFVDFDIEGNSHPECNYDYLKIFDGHDEFSEMAGKYCGSSELKPPDFVSTHNRLFVQFTTDKSVGGTGFYANYSTIDLGCGGILTENLGRVEHPDSTKTEKYGNNQKCQWVISAPIGNVIQLNWINFDLENMHNCDGDSVEIYDNKTFFSESKLIGKYCGNTIPAVITSTSNVMTIKFKSDSSVTANGFTFSYNIIDSKRLCGANYHTSQGVITSPGWPESYSTRRDCEWTITVPNGQQISLSFASFDLENHTSCLGDYLEIRNGGYKQAPLIGKFCGNKIPKILPSMSNTMYLKFHSDISRVGGGFYLTWDGTATGCGGILTSSHGSIISPNYPQPYAHNAQCYWKISVSAGSVIDLIIADMDLEDKTDCKFDYVIIYDGDGDETESLGKFCSQSANPGHVRTTTNHAIIRFRSDANNAGHGFKINYQSVCNLNITGFSGVIESPGYPEPYPPMMDCTWIVRVPTGNKINATFGALDIHSSPFNRNFFKMLLRSSIMPSLTKNCDFDYVQLKDGKDLNYTKKYCGTTIPPLFSTTDENLFVNFHSDYYFSSSGFRLEWKINGCGGNLKRPSGTFTSPGYPKHYNNHIECEWLIEIETGQSIELRIPSIDMETNGDCAFDFLSIYDGPSKSSNLLGTFCHNVDHVITSSSNYMFIHFEADGSHNGAGFSANYKTVKSKCGGKFKGVTGVIVSPNYPKVYGDGLNCLYYIEVPKTHVATLSFNDFDVDTLGRNCTADTVKVYEGNKIDDKKLLGQFCGSTKPPNITASSNEILVQMISNVDKISAKGFKATYGTECGARLIVKKDGSDQIKSHGGLGALSSARNCTWILQSENPGDKISLTITELHLSENLYHNPLDTDLICTHQFIEIYNGDSVNAPKIGKYCTNESPPTLWSSGNALTLLLDIFPRFNGQFSFSYSVLSTACGGQLGAEKGSFASPNYPESYRPNSDCVWKMNTSPGNKASITFNEFNIRSTENCDEDYLEIRTKNESGSLLGVFCGENFPSNISASDSLWIKFHSSETGYGKGFMASYEYIHGNDIEDDVGGKIASPMYPMSYLGDGEFFWRILTAAGGYIRITFKEFYIEEMHDNSCIFSLTIFDGYDETAPVLLTACGYQIPDVIKSSLNVVYIKLDCGGFYHGTKFLLEWVRIPKANNENTNSKTSINCGGNQTVFIAPDNTTHHIQSPGYPQGYDKLLHCEWIFSTSPGNHLVVKFIDMSLEESSDCVADKVTISSAVKNNDGWKEIKKVCLSNATLLSGIESETLMKINFDSDISVNKSGFAAAIYSVCGGPLEGPNGILTYKPKSQFTFFTGSNKPITCQWNITVRAGKTIKVEFTEFSMNGSFSNPCSNYIMLRNGHFSTSPLLGKGKYCGTKIPTDILETTGNHLYISTNFMKYFPRDSGFTLTYKEKSIDCSEDIVLTDEMNRTTISSPNYPDIPNPHTECIWTVKVPTSERIRIDFVDRFDLTSDPLCTKEYVEVFDGSTELSNSLGKFCTSKPETIKSTGNMILLKFFTDVSDPKNGFKANISVDVCGGMIYSSSGRIKSPNMARLAVLNKDVDCLWHIVAPKGRKIVLVLENLLIYNSIQCKKMSFQIFENNLINKTQVPLSDKICGSNGSSSAYQSTSNEAIVNFKASKGFFKSDFHFSLSFNSSKESINYVCTRFFTGKSGEIERSNNCQYIFWKITVPEGRRVTVEIVEGRSPRVVTFYNSRFDSNQLIISAIPNTLPKYINSSDNVMLIVGINPIVFKIKYSSDKPSVCPRGFVDDKGIIPYINETKYICRFKYSMSDKTTGKTITNRTLMVTINNAIFSDTMTNNKYCFRLSRIAIMSTRGISAEICNNVTEPQIYLSPFDNTILEVTKERDPMNYSIEYEVMPCGGFIENFDTFKIPQLPANHTGQIHCGWSFLTSLSNIIEISFGNTNMASDCSKEYIIVKSGRWVNDPQILRYCQDRTEQKFISNTKNTIWIEYHSETFSPLTKFDINVTATSKPTACGGKREGSVGRISSLNYPKGYSENQECEWTITVPKGFKVSLAFISRFSLQTSDNCTKDFVELFDYVNDAYVSMGKVCGRDNPKPFESSSNNAKVLFRSDEAVNGDGFSLRWTTICGGSYEAKEIPSVLRSPGFPTYIRNAKCVYNITAPQGKYIALNFTSFLMENGTSAECLYDNLTLIGTSSLMDETKEVYCGNKSPGYKRFKDKVDLVFKTDGMIEKSGFFLTYSIDSCGGSLTSPGIIRSNSIDNKYHGDMTCVWNITAPEGHFVLIRFKKLVLEFDESCMYDAVSIYEGLKQEESKRLALLCGNQTDHLPRIKSKTNKVSFVLSTNPYQEFDGIEANVLFKTGSSSECGGTINLDNNLKTLNIFNKSPYSPFEECDWLIKTSESNVIVLNFTEFDVSPCFNINDTKKLSCTCDYLEVRDGGGMISPLIGKFCGNSTPNSIVSSKNKLWIRFSSDGEDQGKGLKITLKSKISKCGETSLTLTKEIKEFKSPNYDNGFIPNGLRCLYSLNVNQSDYNYGRILLRFLDMDLGPSEKEEPCMNYVRLSKKRIPAEDEGYGKHLIVSGKNTMNMYDDINEMEYCGNIKPGDVNTFESSLYLLLVTNEETISKHRGLRFEYSLPDCNRNYTGDQGKIHAVLVSENTCNIVISAPENYTINLYIYQPFDLMFMGDCDHDYTAFRDGNSIASPILKKICRDEKQYAIHSSRNSMFIQMVKTAYMSPIYEFVYTTTDQGQGCGGTLNLKSGTIASPSYPKPYRVSKQCTWTLNGPSKNAFEIKFTNFDIGPPGTCHQNYIKIIENENEISMYCPGDIPAEFTTSTNKVKILLQSSLNTGEGFTLYYTSKSLD